jgi:hypothetical protein
VNAEPATLAARYHRAFDARDFDTWREVRNDDVEIIIASISFRGVDAAVEHAVGIASQFPGSCISTERVVTDSGDTVVTEIGYVDGDRPAGFASRQRRVRSAESGMDELSLFAAIT